MIVSRIDWCEFHLHALRRDVEFLGDDHREPGVDPLAHLRLADHDRDAVVRRNAQKSVGHERLVARSAAAGQPAARIVTPRERQPHYETGPHDAGRKHEMAAGDGTVGARLVSGSGSRGHERDSGRSGASSAGRKDTMPPAAFDIACCAAVRYPAHTMELEFFGAAGEVTGSCHIVRAAGKQLLLDCGMIQGGRDAPARNRRDFPFNPQSLDAVVLSHAHLDHCGRLPLLVQRGFRGPIYTNRACRDLLPVLLKDSAKLAERDAERRNRHRDEDDDDVEPLYTLEDVEQTLELVRAFTYDEPHRLFAGITARVRDAGHILGSSSVELWVAEAGATRKLLFSGDLGQYDSPILLDPHAFQQADIVLMESTYGNRLHRDRNATEQELGEVLAAAWRDQGNVIIPAFAIGRSQELLYLFAKHFDDWNMGRWKIFLDSPMAIEASKIYWQHDDRYDQEALHLRAGFGSMPPLPNLVLSRSADQSKAINTMRRGAIIIAGSGMCTGGRILHHLKRQAGCRECHIVFTGFPGAGHARPNDRRSLRQDPDSRATDRIRGTGAHAGRVVGPR